MKKETYDLLEQYMLSCMEDAAHDKEHIYRVLYNGCVSQPLYSVLPIGLVSTGENDTEPSFFQEYKYKLEKLYSRFYTETAKRMAKERQKAAVAFYNHLYQEINSSYQKGAALLAQQFPS